MKKPTHHATPQQKPKVLAVASFGGHLVQLMRIMRPLAEKYEIVYVTTAAEAKPAEEKAKFCVVDDFSRNNPWTIAKSLRDCCSIIRHERPAAVVSTGAAPGLAALMAAKMLGVPTMWIDSIANAEHLSMCGKIASKFATKTLTQWPQLATGKIAYAGTVL